MPMFYTPKPKQFHYRPRFYDPEKEEWEQRKAKYRMRNGLPLDDKKLQEQAAAEQAAAESSDADKDLAYFKEKVRDIDRKEHARRQRLTIMDLFRKREKPQFHYVSRFDSNGELKETPNEPINDRPVKKRFKRRFDDEDSMDRFKPIPAGKIIVYTFIAVLLLMFIFLGGPL